jgi:hypothetical protein
MLICRYSLQSYQIDYTELRSRMDRIREIVASILDQEATLPTQIYSVVRIYYRQILG